MLGTTSNDLEVTKVDASTITVTPTPAGLQQRIANAASAAIETVNRRINNLGTAESTVIRQGRDRILVQFPGLAGHQAAQEAHRRDGKADVP